MAATNWIEWSGGECPVPENTPVELRYRETNGQAFAFAPQMAKWAHRPRKCAADIIGYRLLSKAEVEAHLADCEARREALNRILADSFNPAARAIAEKSA